MGLIVIHCSKCNVPFAWYSGRGTDQLCEKCKNDELHPFKDIEGEDFAEYPPVRSAEEIYEELLKRLLEERRNNNLVDPLGPTVESLLRAMADSLHREAVKLFLIVERHFEKKKP